MRDDLAVLFNDIKQHLEKKISLLIEFRNREFELKNLLNLHNVDDINEILLAEDFIISEIDSCDFNISAAVDRIKLITGIDLLQSGTGTYFKDEPDIQELNKGFAAVSEIIAEVSRLRSENISRMEKISSEISDASDELERIDKVQRRFFKGLQSS